MALYNSFSYLYIILKNSVLYLAMLFLLGLEFKFKDSSYI